MLKGTVSFRTEIRGFGLAFPPVECDPRAPGVEKIVLEGDGNRITSTVHVTAVANEKDGRAIATEVNTAALDRIAFAYQAAIDHAILASSQFSQLTPQPGVVVVSTAEVMCVIEGAHPVLGIDVNQLKATLEETAPTGEEHFGLFRSARQSTGHVEEFMHLYHMLLMFCGDSQPKVDAFIQANEPGVLITPSPKNPAITETIYTRLRNELAHRRLGVDLHGTKSEMKNRLSGLVSLVKQAIEQS